VVRGVPLFLILILIGTLVGYVSPSSAATPPAELGLGYSATSVVPISAGVPVYMRGDQLWAESFYSYPVVVTLFAPNQTVVTAERYLYPTSTGILYVFGDNDSLGTWKIMLIDSAAPPVFFQLVQEESSNASVTGLSLSGNTATYSVSVNGDFNSDQACLLGEASSSVTVKLPPLLSTGALRVQWQEGSLTVTRNGTVLSPYTYSFELLQSYSYELPGSSGLDTVQLEVGFSNPVVVTQVNTSAQLIPLTWLATPREGEFDLRTVVSSPAEAQVAESSVLYTRGGLVSLDLCAPLVSVPSSSFKLSADLDLPPSRWPRQLLLVSMQGGVESYAFYSIPWSVARAEIVGGQSGKPLSSTSATVGSVPAGGLVSTFGGEVFFAGPQESFPTTVQVGLSQLGRTWRLNATFVAPFTAELLRASTGSLNVNVTSGGKALSNASVTVVGPGGSITRLSGTRPLLFELLPGSYNLTAQQGAQTETRTVLVVSGNTARAAMDLTPQSSDIQLVLFVAVALVGVASNGVVWFVLPRRGP